MKRAGIFAGSLIMLAIAGCSDDEPKPTGLPGDNLDLYAVLDVFKSSKSIEAFEKSLNDKSTGVNNLDLNGDEKVDYIRVIDLRDGDAHAITLRVPVSGEESQDVAVIQIEKTGEQAASVQIVGDEVVYGKDVIIEPKEEKEKAGFVYASAVGVNVYYWPSVTYIYSPAYVVWESPYHYDYYPVYWNPWPPVAYEVYYPVVYKNHGQYVAYNKHRFKHANEIYYSNRMHSGFVMTRHKNGDFHGGKQPRYKGNYSPKGHDGYGGNDKKHDGFDGGKEKGGKQDNRDAWQGNDKGKDNQRGQQDHRGGQDNKGDHKKSGDNSPKASSPKGGSDHRQGGGNKNGGSPKNGGGNKGGGNKGGGGKNK